MEKITCICVMRELFTALSCLEKELTEIHGVNLNEAMVLCALGNEHVTASDISNRTGMLPSHTSKVIGSLEKLRLIERQLGKQDKRKIYLSLTKEGKSRLERIKIHELDIPDILEPLFKKYAKQQEP